MPRVKLKLPKKFLFSTEIRVRISDINYGGHLGNEAILALIHEARVRLLKEYGFTELNIDGYGLIMINSVVIYKTESFYGETLKFEISTENFDKYGCDFIYKITKKETGKEVVRAKTGMVFFDYEIRKIAEVPKIFKSIFASKE
ncbi:MAG: acyl-CoA thioesterase [bacterium]